MGWLLPCDHDRIPLQTRPVETGTYKASPAPVDYTVHLTASELSRRFQAPPSSSKLPINLLDFAPADATPVQAIRQILFADKNDLLPNLWKKVTSSPSALATEMRAGRPPYSWATICESGGLTTPHMDIDGLSTFLTVAQGQFLFAYCSSMSPAALDQWHKQSILTPLPDCRWQYVLMKTGQTVVFPAGTPHAVIRDIADNHTMTFGATFFLSIKFTASLLCVSGSSPIQTPPR
ncbi:unnamed protein product [Zymoseptoria tritici ST99CH_1E4]|uniref:JmjC domain-containing protein n=1 Tax=Zymoseptoria tritici ST99CH_1E4 TaxID=1276532 RepID=A0A2H1H9U6_ZYMTR|nr:unnamed protein product [Zymoseptoria tritici ST99CH_1E4]